MTLRPYLITLLLPGILLLGACGTTDKITQSISEYMKGKDNSLPPSELVKFQSTVKIDTLWSIDVGSGTDEQFLRLTPVVDADTVYTAGHEGQVTAVALASGKQLWENETDLPISGGPGVGAGLVVVGTNDGDVVALAKDSGKALWRARVSSEVLAAPRIDDGVVIIRTGDGRITALSAADGKRLWFYDNPVPALSLRGVSAPAIAQGLVVVGLDNGKLLALELKTGRLAWNATVAVPHGRSDLDRMVDIDSEPLIIDDEIYVATYQGRVASVSLQNGRLRWARDISSDAGVGANDNALFVTDEESNVWALERLSGTSIWKQEKLLRRRLTAPIPLGDYVAVGDFEGYVHWLRTSDGQFVARSRVGSDPIIARPIAVGDILLVYGSGGTLAALRPQP